MDAETAATPPSADFSTVVAQLLLAVEELRQSQQQQKALDLDQIFEYQSALDGLLPGLDQLARWTADRADDQAVEADMFRHVQSKAAVAAHETLKLMMKFAEPTSEDDNSEHESPDQAAAAGPVDEVLREFQGVVAQTTELCLRMVAEAPADAPIPIPSIEEVVKDYVSFQRHTLRARVKPTIAKLVHERKRGFSTAATAAVPAQAQIYSEESDDNDDDGGQAGSSGPQQQQQSASSYGEKHHANALAVILGQAAALMNPLLAWKVNLPPPHVSHPDPVARALSRLCLESLQILDEQAQQLTKTVSDWFWQDRPAVDEYLQSSAATEERRVEPHALAGLDGLVDEMALSCLLLAQYQSLTADLHQTGGVAVLGKEFLPEWTWKYAALERYLAVQQWQAALNLAQPVQIVISTSVYVPSVVEDAQYLSTRALERAASTQALQAIGTAAHAVAQNVWSDDLPGGVPQALADERGCWMEPEPASSPNEEATTSTAQAVPAKNNFTSALLDALDEDLGTATGTTSKPKAATPPRSSNNSSKPSSGNFLTAFSALGSGGGGENMRLMQMQARFCALNGLHAAAGACRSLVDYLDSLIADNGDNSDESTQQQQQEDEKAMAMIQLAREELFRYAHNYQFTLDQKASELIVEYCLVSETQVIRHGLALDHLRAFVAHEPYNIDSAAELHRLEADERLEVELMGPLQAYVFLQQLSSRCELNVLARVGELLVARVVDVILTTLWGAPGLNKAKVFTDWGALLFAKEMRLIHSYLQQCLTASDAAAAGYASHSWVGKWERLTQVMDILQMEKPSEWLLYSAGSVLSAHEVKQTMGLRSSFTPESIAAVVASASQNTPPADTMADHVRS